MTRFALPRIGLLALIWGSAFLWIKLADRGFSPVEVTLARLALGAAVLFAIVLARREPVPRSARLWGHIAVAALFANAVPYLLFAVAEQTVDSSTAGIINATTPLWTVVLALTVRHQKSVTSWQAGGLILGFAGAVLIFTPWHTAGGLLSAGGLECLAASVSYAVSYIYMDRFLARRGIGSVLLSACQLAAAAVMLAAALAVSGAQTPHVTAGDVAAIAVLGIIGTGIAVLPPDVRHVAAKEMGVAVRGRWPLMLRTGWVVVRRMTRVSPSANSTARVVSETWTVTVCPAWERPRASRTPPRRA